MAAPMDFLSGMVGKVTFVNKWPLLLKATQDDDVPTPGYLYKEISDLSYESGNTCQCLVDFLAERLDKNSCHIKFKVMKIMLHLVEHGHEAFSVGLRRQAQGIQQATKHSGAPHPLHGMAPYVAVRKIAKELSEKLFDTEYKSRGRNGNQFGSSGITNYSMPQQLIGSKKLQGFGNTSVSSDKPVTMESVSESVKEGLQHIASKLGGENKSRLSSQPDSGYKMLHGADGHQAQSQRHGYSNRSANWFPPPRQDSYSSVSLEDEEEDSNQETSTKSSFTETRKQLSADKKASSRQSTSPSLPLLKDVVISGSNDGKGSDQLSGGSLDLSERLASVSSPDWSEEVAAVDSLVSLQMNRPTPTKEELQQFVKRSSSLNCQMILQLLTTHMKSSPGSQLRCLFGVEGILKEDLVSSDVALSLLTSHLQALQASPDRAIRPKATKILRQLEKLEADTTLDQPLITNGPLIPNPSQRITSQGTVQSAASSSINLDTQLSLDLMSEPVLVESEHRGALFSGMTLAIKTDEPSPDSNSASTLVGDTVNRTAIATHSPEDVLLDAKLQVSRIEEDLLLADVQGLDSAGQDFKFDRGMESLSCREQNERNTAPTLQECLKTDSVRHTHTDPIMSRGASFSELLECASPSKSSKSSNSPLTEQSNSISKLNSPLKSLAKPAMASQQTGSVLPQVGMTMQQPKMTPQEIARIYPNLSSAALSGMTSTPLNLSKRPTAGFGFVQTDKDSEKEKESSGTKHDAFSFVQDVMKTSKK